MLYGLLTVTYRIASGVLLNISVYIQSMFSVKFFALTLTLFARIASGVPSELLPLMQVHKQPSNPFK